MLSLLPFSPSLTPLLRTTRALTYSIYLNIHILQIWTYNYIYISLIWTFKHLHLIYLNFQTFTSHLSELSNIYIWIKHLNKTHLTHAASQSHPWPCPPSKKIYLIFSFSKPQDFNRKNHHIFVPLIVAQSPALKMFWYIPALPLQLWTCV